MTFIEKFKKESSNEVRDGYKIGCPYIFGYEQVSNCPPNCSSCEECWNREMPGTDSNASTILDSGDRTEFETGAVRDMREGKGRCDLMPLDAISDFFYHNSAGKSTTQEFKLQMVFGHIANFTINGDYNHLFDALNAAEPFDNKYDMFLEVAKHFEDGAKKYGENNWQKGIPTKCYIDSAVRHYLKYLRGDTDERHDRAFVWNILCCIWTCKHKPELNDYKKEIDNP